jgi:hypothetical protein
MALMKVVPDWQDTRKLQVILWDNDGRCGYNDFSDAELMAYGFPTTQVYSFYSNIQYDWSSDSYYCPPGTEIYNEPGLFGGDGASYCATVQNVIAKKGQYHRANTYTFDDPVSDLANYYYNFSSSGWGCNNVSGVTSTSRVVSNNGVLRDYSGISANDTLTSCPGQSAQWPTLNFWGGSITGLTNGCQPGYVKGNNPNYTTGILSDNGNWISPVTSGNTISAYNGGVSTDTRWLAKKDFYAPVSGTYSISGTADDNAEIYVDNNYLGYASWSSFPNIQIEQGNHTLIVKVINGCSTCEVSGNPTSLNIALNSPTGQTVATTDSSWQVEAISSSTQCTYNYPATATTYTATPGCLGAPIPSGAADGGTQLVAGMVNGQAGSVCQTTYYSCPTGMNMNGMQCEDPSKPAYQNPNCKYLGKDTNTQGETYLCINNKLDECADLDLSKCTNTNNTCVFTDNVVGSDTYGQCIATEKDYSCPTPAQTKTISKCGYDPMCFNGNCFTPPGTNCAGNTTTTTKTEAKTCNVMTQQVYRQCSLVEKVNAQGIATGYTAGADCANINNQGGTALTCTQIPPTLDTTTGHYPQKLNYSCLSSPVSECSTLASTAGCSASSSQCLEYQCLDPVSNTLGSQEQAGTNTTPIATSASGGAVPMPGVDLNTCVNKGACINEQKTYQCTSTTTTPGDECTTDLSKVLVSMETAREAGVYMDPAKMKIFSGEFSRCDRRLAAIPYMGNTPGGILGSKSCCNIDSPDPKSNADVLNAPSGTGLIVGGVTKASGYMFDYMMNTDTFQEAGQMAWGAGVISDGMQESIAGANPTFDPSSLASYSPIGGVSIGFGAGASSTLGFSSTTYSLGGGLNLTFTPALFYVAIAMKIYQMYQAALACDEEDYKSSTKGKAKLCYDTGTWCESKDCGLWGCTCIKYRTGKCCYNSKLARIINQQGRAQLGLDMRDCSGFTVAQIQQLDWSRIDLSEFLADVLAQAQASTSSVMSSATQGKLQSNVQSKAITNASTGSQPMPPVLKPSAK